MDQKSSKREVDLHAVAFGVMLPPLSWQSQHTSAIGVSDQLFIFGDSKVDTAEHMAHGVSVCLMARVIVFQRFVMAR